MVPGIGIMAGPAPEGMPRRARAVGLAATGKELTRFGRSILAAALLGRWEEIFFQLSTLSKLVVELALRALQKRKFKVQRWLSTPMLSSLARGASPPWARSRLPLGPLLAIKRWHVILGSAAAA